jgi:hypothetical protein
MAAIAAARRGRSAIILERTSHVGGLPANGLGATDIATRGVAAGLFKEFTGRIRRFYSATYGEDSEQVRASSDGYHFEPSVGEKILLEMLAECPSITVHTMRQFDALPERVGVRDGCIQSVTVRNLAAGTDETYAGAAFIDATYEGDLAAAAGVPFATRREGFSDYHEPKAGRFYQKWGSSELGEGSTLEGDDTIQAYNFRLCLTDRPENMTPFPKPPDYDRSEYASLAEDLKLDRMPGVHVREREWDGIGRITNVVWLPNGKTDANNQHLAFISTDLPEENYLWPVSDWAWRDRFQSRLRNYTLGLFWFLQNDPDVPETFRTSARRFGLASDEYTDNGNFPRQVYVREGRRIFGEYCFTAHDAIPVTPDGRPPVHATSIAASHYAVDSHAVRKREPGRDHLDGFLSLRTKPYTVPYGVMVPKTVENLWVPVAVSASHLGFGTLRMEPCWMALGEAAGTAATLAIALGLPARSVPIDRLQRDLVSAGAMLVYFRDVTPADPNGAKLSPKGATSNSPGQGGEADAALGFPAKNAACPEWAASQNRLNLAPFPEDPAFAALQFLGVRGAIPDWDARLDDPATADEWERWTRIAGIATVPLPPDASRREALARLSASLAP